MGTLEFIPSQQISRLARGQFASLLGRATQALEALKAGDCAGRDFLGWLHLPSRTLPAQTQAIEELANRIRSAFDTVVIVGIGGSYLGAAALLEALANDGRPEPEIVFMGQTLCPDYLQSTLHRLRGRRFAVVVISKSGTTTEPAVSFRLLLEVLGAEWSEKRNDCQIVAITDARRGALHDMAVKNGWQRLVIPDDVGGRFSVLTPVGLLPLALGGRDIEGLLNGAKAAEEQLLEAGADDNIALQYAAARKLLYDSGKRVEFFSTYTPYLRGFQEWLKQLFAESEGKNGKGILPASACFTTDLHSLGQYIQEGERMLFETHIQVGVGDREAAALAFSPKEGDDDGLNYLAKRPIAEINDVARAATVAAHEQGGVPCLQIRIPQRNAYWLGYTIYFFELACAVSVLLQGENPFNQPGVEAYKRNMFELLGKPGYGVVQNPGQ
ncbi:MAG: glucose-6-phosphate isomerase [Bacteroides sp.]|jgi:Glucose-6-phosphate isomerase